VHLIAIIYLVYIYFIADKRKDLYAEYGKSKNVAFATTILLNVFLFCCISQTFFEIARQNEIILDVWQSYGVIFISFSICTYIEYKLVAGARRRYEEQAATNSAMATDDYLMQKELDKEVEGDEDEGRREF
jgi:amino acid permease